jgi:hypothetical protein
LISVGVDGGDDVGATNEGAVGARVDVVEGAAELAAEALGREDLEVNLGALLGAAAHDAHAAHEIARLGALVERDDGARGERRLGLARRARQGLHPRDHLGVG